MQAKTPGEYSPRNQLVILTHQPDATRLAGYRQWKTMGRQVRKGERGITITITAHGARHAQGRRRLEDCERARRDRLRRLTDRRDPERSSR